MPIDFTVVFYPAPATGTTGRLILWCTFSAETSYEPRYEDLDLDFNPASGFHHYSIDMYSVADEAVTVCSQTRGLW